MKKTTMIISAIVIVSVIAGFTLLNNEGVIDSILNEVNIEGNGNTNTNGDNEGPSNTDYTNNDSNQDGSIVGNWTFVSSETNGEPVTHVTSAWVNYKADGTWTYFYDYGYTTVNDEGTWQAQDGVLYWGTEGHEISDWYSVDNYEVTGDDLIITTDEGTRAVYRRD